ncbi:MAG TPA: hypothetical protein VHX88_09575 [Solirubrobacteraceae bacterium]|jgi:hypothetical protein|nr:hypothetical protein [Solirubrobacteraceae bacterium]
MTEVQVQRRLVKSPPELWAEVSEPAALARLFADLAGEIKITRTEPESTVAWEGELASGTVELEAAGWGTRVTLTVAQREPEPAPPEPEPEPEPPAPVLLAPPPPPRAPVAAPEPRRGLLARLLRRGRPAAPVMVAAPEPTAAPTAPEAPRIYPNPPAAPAREPAPEFDGERLLDGVLDALGAAHHRPFSRN